VDIDAACEIIPVTSGDGTTATVGGLFGETAYLPATHVMGCFWDAELSSVSVGAGSDLAYYGTGLTTAQMYRKGDTVSANNRTIKAALNGDNLVLACVLASHAYGFAAVRASRTIRIKLLRSNKPISVGSDPNPLDRSFVLTADIDLDPNPPGGTVFDRAVIAPTANGTEDLW